MAVVVMTIVPIRKCVLKLAGEAKIKIPSFPKETQNVEYHCVSEKYEINGEKFIFAFKCCPALKKEEEKNMMISCAVRSPSKGVTMKYQLCTKALKLLFALLIAKKLLIRA